MLNDQLNSNDNTTILTLDMTSPQSTNSTLPAYCGKSMDDFHTAYFQLHGYISLIVCILGSIANSLNIIVLTRREMQSPTNFILTGLAIADLSVMIEYIPYAIHSYIHKYMGYTEEELYTYDWTVYVKFHSIFGQICHTISIWLTVTLAIWRYIAVSYPQRNRVLCGMKNTIITIAAAYIICPLIVVPPSYLSFAVTHKIKTIEEFEIKLSSTANSSNISNSNGDGNGGVSNNSNNLNYYDNFLNGKINNEINSSDNYITPIEYNNYIMTTIPNLITTMTATTSITATLNNENNITRYRNITLYNIQISQLAKEYEMLYNLNVWIYTILIKLIPCIALTILSLRLIAALLEAKRRRKLLSATNNVNVNMNDMKQVINGKTIEAKSRKNSKMLEKEKQTDRTTRMLLAVLLLFLITEFPQAILGFLVLYLEKTFMFNCYLKLGDLMDILALINSGINFILYCSMSRQFRSTFSLLFRPKFLDRWLPVSQEENHNGPTTYAGGDNNFLTTQVTQV